MMAGDNDSNLEFTYTKQEGFNLIRDCSDRSSDFL